MIKYFKDFWAAIRPTLFIGIFIIPTLVFGMRWIAGPLPFDQSIGVWHMLILMYFAYAVMLLLLGFSSASSTRTATAQTNDKIVELRQSHRAYRIRHLRWMVYHLPLDMPIVLKDVDDYNLTGQIVDINGIPTLVFMKVQ